MQCTVRCFHTNGYCYMNISVVQISLYAARARAPPFTFTIHQHQHRGVRKKNVCMTANLTANSPRTNQIVLFSEHATMCSHGQLDCYKNGNEIVHVKCVAKVIRREWNERRSG